MPRRSETNYFSFLIRGWLESTEANSSSDTWRFALEDPTTRTKRGFSSFDALVAFLKNQTRVSKAKEDDGKATRGS